MVATFSGKGLLSTLATASGAYCTLGLTCACGEDEPNEIRLHTAFEVSIAPLTRLLGSFSHHTVALLTGTDTQAKTIA